MPKGKFNEIKATPWKGNDLEGTWEITLKIDGARMLRDSSGNPVSRAGKPLYNLDHISKEITDAEIYETDWETSMGLVRSSVNGKAVDMEKVYSLDPLDSRLHLGYFENPKVDEIEIFMRKQVDLGFEGLILRQGNKWLKVKPKETADVYVTGYQAGTGKHEGRMGALLTNYGKIGTGFSDADREEWAHRHQEDPNNFGNQEYLIEVEYMEWTSGGKFRHPRFIRIRDDKTEENVNT